MSIDSRKPPVTAPGRDATEVVPPHGRNRVPTSSSAHIGAMRAPITLRPVEWHRPLLWLGMVMTALAVFCAIALLVDDRQLLGVGVWEKPLKFAVSTAIYAFTWSWLTGQLLRGRRLAWWVGTVSVVLLAIELVIITGAAAVGVTSHFNVASTLAVTLWAIMAASISTLWVLNLIVSFMLFRAPIGDAARTLAIRAGAVLALVGMALAFLMTGPTAEQLNDFQGVAGAHAVGMADGGPGLPVLGWSTVAGDLRIPHFVGMHALQVIPLFLIAVELLSRRVAVFRREAVRFRLVLIVTGAYSAVLALLTWQALRGQSIVQPDALTLVAGAAIAVIALAAAGVAVLRRPVAEVAALR